MLELCPDCESELVAGDSGEPECEPGWWCPECQVFWSDDDLADAWEKNAEEARQNYPREDFE